MSNWRYIQKKNFTKISNLGLYLGLNLSYRSKFPLNLPLRLAQKIEKKNINDPILKQFLPSHNEDIPSDIFHKDPVKDNLFQITPQMLQKYHGRVLLLPTSACAMHCRYCFRQNYPYHSEGDFQKELDTIKNDLTIHEVILSGGDPLSLSDTRLENLVKDLEKIPHIKIIRFHTRFPIGIPERICESFTKILEQSRFQFIFIIHVNHAKELDNVVFNSLKKLQTLGIPILSQTVLLAGVNDNKQTLKNLFLTLIHNGIIPYYLHQLDPIMQGQHFDVPIEKGLTIIKELEKDLPGYAVPKYVREIPFEKSKQTVKAPKSTSYPSF